MQSKNIMYPKLIIHADECQSADLVAYGSNISVFYHRLKTYIQGVGGGSIL